MRIMAIKANREYRRFAMPLMTRAAENTDGGEALEKDYHVEGYAATFDPYCMGKDLETGRAFYERIDQHAFDEADISDVVLRYDHMGMVYARQKNGSLDVSVDEKGLKISADLSLTQEARSMYEAIDKGLIDQMSFCFSVDDEGVEYDSQSSTRTITRIRKVYDVSPVSIPANPDTDICAMQARDYIHGVMDMEKAERLEREKKIALAKAMFACKTI